MYEVTLIYARHHLMTLLQSLGQLMNLVMLVMADKMWSLWSLP
jgi:hypothetical protein